MLPRAVLMNQAGRRPASWGGLETVFRHPFLRGVSVGFSPSTLS